jgi:hypothetical protein
MWLGFATRSALDYNDPDDEGETALIAAMRAYVASKFGDTVPDEATAGW